MSTRPVFRILTVGVASLGLLTLAGCAVDGAVANTSGAGTSSGTSSSSRYADGTYTVDAGYHAPSGSESMTVELTIAGDAVTAVTVTGDATDREAAQYQDRFSSAISSEVVGRDISGLSVSRIAGASLTSKGFNTALDEIRSQAS